MPYLAPPGPYSMRMSATDAAANVMCMDIWFRIVTAPSAVQSPSVARLPQSAPAAGWFRSARAAPRPGRRWPRFLRWPAAPPERVVEA